MNLLADLRSAVISTLSNPVITTVQIGGAPQTIRQCTGCSAPFDGRHTLTRLRTPRVRRYRSQQHAGRVS
jgi:hypothetical protein